MERRFCIAAFSGGRSQQSISGSNRPLSPRDGGRFWRSVVFADPGGVGGWCGWCGWCGWAFLWSEDPPPPPHLPLCVSGPCGHAARLHLERSRRPGRLEALGLERILGSPTGAALAGGEAGAGEAREATAAAAAATTAGVEGSYTISGSRG